MLGVFRSFEDVEARKTPQGTRVTRNLLGDFPECKSLVALLLHYTGEQPANYHHHARRETIYIGVEGSGILLMDGKEYKMEPGKYAWLPPGTRHTIVDATPDLKMFEIYCGKGDPQINVYDEMPARFDSREGLREERKK